MDSNTVIKLDNVSKRYNVYSRNIDRIKGVIFGREPAEVKHALNGISMEIYKGERLAILGVTDSGRSTLAKVIAGVTIPSKGKINIFGNSMNVMLDARVGIDMEFSCRENIYMKANIAGITREKIKSHVDEILEFAEVTDFADLPLKRAPKGTVALISLAVHLVHEADILIVDEVFGGGGNRVASKCEARLAEYAEENPEKTVLVISNRGYFVRQFATRTMVLDFGNIAYDGETEKAIELFKIKNGRRK